MSVGVGDLTTVTFATSGFTAEIVSVVHDGITRAIIDRTHLNSTAGGKQFLLSRLIDYGTTTLNIHFSPGDAIPIDGDFETVTIDWGDQGSPWSFSGAISEMSGVTANIDEIMSCTITIKVDGVITGI